MITPSPKRKIALYALVALALTACDRGAPELTLVAATDGFVAPESVFFDRETKSWFVSNIGMSEVAGDGFISQLDADGQILESKLVTGLDDPKGIRVADGVLYVADVTVLVRVALTAPGEVERIEVPGAMFLNDVAIDRRGDVYVSDSFGNAIYRLSDGLVSELARTSELQTPNGLLVQGRSLIIATIGPDPDPETFTTSEPGRLLSLDLDTLELTPISEPIGLLDGLEALGSGFVVSDYTLGLYYVDDANAPNLILDNVAAGLGSSADIGHAPSLDRIAVPELTGTRVLFYDYTFPSD